ncbi:hypothetical protein TL16_g09767, partial [Triparma laevis f. inornata]
MSKTSFIPSQKSLQSSAAFPLKPSSAVTSADIGSRRQDTGCNNLNNHSDQQPPPPANNSNIPESFKKKYALPKKINTAFPPKFQDEGADMKRLIEEKRLEAQRKREAKLLQQQAPNFALPPKPPPSANATNFDQKRLEASRKRGAKQQQQQQQQQILNPNPTFPSGTFQYPANETATLIPNPAPNTTTPHPRSPSKNPYNVSNQDSFTSNNDDFDWDAIDVEKVIAEEKKAVVTVPARHVLKPLPTPIPTPSNPTSTLRPQPQSTTYSATQPLPDPHPLSQPLDQPLSQTLVQPYTRIPYNKDGLDTALIDAADIKSDLHNGWALKKHQKIAVVRAIKARRLICAYDMGLGKTVIGCVAAKAFNSVFENCRTVIVCPKTMRSDWEKTAEECVGGIGDFELYNWGAPNSIPKPPLNDFVGNAKTTVVGGKRKKQQKITAKKKTKKKKSACGRKNPDSSDSEVDDLSSTDNSSDESDDDEIIRKNLRGHAEMSLSAQPNRFFLVCDEAHNLQSAKAKMTQAVIKLALNKNCVGVLLLTGTPMKNGKPLNLFPLLKIIRHSLGKNQRKFEERYCEGQYKRFGMKPEIWDASGSSNLEELKDKMGDYCLRKTKEECLNLKDKVRIIRKVELPKKAYIDYKRVIGELKQVHEKRETSTSGTTMLGALQRISQCCSYSKVDAAVEVAVEVLAVKDSVVIFTGFVKTAKAIVNKFKEVHDLDSELITGEVTKKEAREAAVERFQTKQTSIFIGTFGAAGTGLTLTAASTVILVDRAWTPGDCFQAEDRIQRIGQTEQCSCVWLSAFVWDEQVDAAVNSKQETTSSVIEKKSKASSGEGKGSSISINKLIDFALKEARYFGKKEEEKGQTSLASFGFSQEVK